MKYLIFILLLILLILSYYLSKKIMTLNNEYNRVVDKHTALFSMIKKKTETITADKDEEVVETLEKINTISDLNQRIIEILNYPDTSMNDDILAALNDYNEEVEHWDQVKKENRRLSMMLGYIEYNKYKVKL
ncbi:MAG: hypothetical protein SOW61_02620 [Erysipelotrichaceae bacterium]|nr:hypothetical protein [Erysipelotrichaceae bacterium]